MRRGSHTSARAATALATFLALSAAPAAAQRAPVRTVANTSVSPRQIAANAHAALLMIRALGDHGDTIGLGTGFVVSSDGLFVTNYHVIQDASRLRVKLLDGGEYQDVQLVAADPAYDLAIMRIPAQGLHPLRVGRDVQAEVGDRVFVMGNPLGMTGTFSDGMVSGKRPLEGVSMLQISAPISPGSSGGPVMNERGEVIGVATMMVMGGQNLNMAVPIGYLQPVMGAHPAPRPFSSALLDPNPHSGLALVGDDDAPRGRREAARREPASRDPQQEVEVQMTMVSPLLRLRGFIAAFPTLLGEAAQGAEETHEVQLERGVSYLITGRCDADCANVDLALSDANGSLIRSDDERDDYPTVGFVPPQTGTYRITLKMTQCSSAPCEYGIGVFRQDANAAPARTSQTPAPASKE